MREFIKQIFVHNNGCYINTVKFFEKYFCTFHNPCLCKTIIILFCELPIYT